jgi:Borealin
LTANVNIPVANGILSIRPQIIDPTNLDASMINKIDSHTFNHLRTLKANLDVLMAGFNRKFNH